MNNANTHSDSPRTIQYKFKFSENNEHTFSIQWDSQTLDLIHEPKNAYPDWTKLQCQKCSNCPLNEAEHEYCPIAVKLVDIIDFFCKPLDCEDIGLTVETPERVFRKKVTLKSATVSLIGLYMATSGCPIMDQLRPMARFHLPFATTPETTYRSLSNYLVAQYLLAHQGKNPDWELKNLGSIYDAIKTVNTHFRERLLKASNQSYALHAILTLDAFAYYINLSLIGNTFYTIESLFNDELQETGISFDSPQEDESNIDTYQYQFKFDSGYLQEFPLRINRETLRLIDLQKDSYPSWTKLTCKKCPNCPLDEKRYQHCPAATAMADTIEFFSETPPAESVNVSIKTADRDFFKYTTVTDGFNSMASLILISSGCPVLSKLRPLVRNYLPFETAEERAYRSLGMYLLQQKFLGKSGKDPDWSLNDFTKFYEEINIVNEAFCSRLRELTIEEDSLHALTKLDCFTQYINFKISTTEIEDLQRLFAKSHYGEDQ